MKITDHVGADKTVQFSYYREGHFYYMTDAGLVFPVPVDDIGTATMLAADKSVYFMRWIRKHLAVIEEAKLEQDKTTAGE